jgi:hypothetical protein
VSGAAAIKRILAWVDGSAKDRAVLDHALQVAQQFAGHVDVLHSAFRPSGRVRRPLRAVRRPPARHPD